MSHSLREDPRVETLLYTIVLIIGVSLIAVSFYQSTSFRQSLLLSLGTNMVVVTVVFLIFKFFGRSPVTGTSPDYTANFETITAQLRGIKDEVTGMRTDIYHVDRATTDKLLDTQTKILMHYTYAKLDRFPDQPSQDDPSSK